MKTINEAVNWTLVAMNCWFAVEGTVHLMRSVNLFTAIVLTALIVRK